MAVPHDNDLPILKSWATDVVLADLKSAGCRARLLNSIAYVRVDRDQGQVLQTLHRDVLRPGTLPHSPHPRGCGHVPTL